MTEEIVETFEQKLEKAPEVVKEFKRKQEQGATDIEHLRLVHSNAVSDALLNICKDSNGKYDPKLLENKKENADTIKAVADSIEKALWDYVVEDSGIKDLKTLERDNEYRTLLMEGRTGISFADLTKVIKSAGRNFYQTYMASLEDKEKGWLLPRIKDLNKSVKSHIEDKDKQTLLDWSGAGKYVQSGIIPLEAAVSMAQDKLKSGSDLTVDYFGQNKEVLKPEYQAMFN